MPFDSNNNSSANDKTKFDKNNLVDSADLTKARTLADSAKLTTASLTTPPLIAKSTISVARIDQSVANPSETVADSDKSNPVKNNNNNKRIKRKPSKNKNDWRIRDGKHPKHFNYKALLADPDFNRWYLNLKRGSPVVADERLRRIGYVCRVFGQTTQGLAKMTVKDGTNLILDVITKLDMERKSSEYMKAYVKALKSWFGFNGIKIDQDFKLPDTSSSVETKVSQEQSPTPDQVRKVFDVADVKEKVSCAGIGYCGLRPETLGNYEGTDGLKVMDLPEMQIDNEAKTVTFLKVPTMVVVRSNLSKAGHQYFTFLGQEGCTYLKEFLELRLRSGEVFTPRTPIVITITNNKSGNNHIRTPNVSRSIRVPIRIAGFDWRPYILRTYFDTRMMMAEADGYIIKDWRTFWMGHKGDIEAVYTLNKRKLPEDLVEKMRAAFAKASERYLEAGGMRNGATIQQMQIILNKDMLAMGGMPQEEIDKIPEAELEKLTIEEIKQMVQSYQKKAMFGLNGNNQKVIPVEELKKWIAEGWEFVAIIPPTNTEAIVKLPTTK